MSSNPYPTSEELYLADEELEEVLANAVEEIMAMRGANFGASGKANPDKQPPTSFDVNDSFNFEYGRSSYKHPTENTTYETPYQIDDYERMMVCRTSEYDPNTDSLKVIEANPNDPSHLFYAMSLQGEQDHKVKKTLESFQERGITTVSQVSAHFVGDAMKALYASKGLDETIISNPSSKNVSFIKGNYNQDKVASYAFAVANKGFDEEFKKNMLLQMNHRITQEAIERGRDFFPNGDQLQQEDRGIGKEAFHRGRFKTIADEAAKNAFDRTLHYMMLNQVKQQVRQELKTYQQDFKEKIKPKIVNENLVSAFGKEFKARAHENRSDAIKRIQKEYKAFANKKLDQLQGKGLDTIMAQGLAKTRGQSSVSADDIKEARQLFDNARKNPVKYHSTEAIIRQVTGKNADLTRDLMRNLDGRSTFQRSLKTMESLGSHLNAHKQDRTRVRADDKVEGRAFAATVLLNRDTKLKTSLVKTIGDRGYSPDDAMKARAKMLRSAGKIKTERGEITNRQRILKAVAPQVTRSPTRSKPGSDGPTPGGNTPSRKKPRR